MKILLANDDDALAVQLQRFIQGEIGHTVLLATDEHAADFCLDLDLLITEAVMLPIDGIALSRLLGKRNPDLKTLFNHPLRPERIFRAF